MKPILSRLLLALAAGTLLSCQPDNAPPASATPSPTQGQTAAVNVAKPVAAAALQPLAANWWQDAVVYQIWPRSFADSDADGHGDFAGIQSRLPYLAELGVDAIWLTPVFEAPSYHGYDFTEFYQVEADYGSMAQFEQLIQAASSKNIKVILDLVINHISDQHDWFQRSAKGEAPYRDYFIWRTELPTDGWGPAWDSTKTDPKAVWHYHPQRKQYYYGAFGPSQPDLDLTQSAVVAEMKKMAKFWLDKGVAGFRLDAVRYAIENGPGQQADTAQTQAYWQDFSSFVRSVQPNALLVGEAWADLPVAASYYGDGKGLAAGFDFEFGYQVLALLQGDAGVKAEFGTMQQGTATGEQQLLQQNYLKRLATKVPLGYFSPFLTNHDQPRIGYQLAGNQAKAKLAAAMLLSSPGTSYLYYGEEIGLSQASDAEHIQRRAPMLWDSSAQGGFTKAPQAWVQSGTLFPPQQSTDWWPAFLASQLSAGVTVADQQAQPQSLWRLYQLLLQLKKTRPEFGVAGSYQAEQLAGTSLLQISRAFATAQTLMLFNVSAQPQQLPKALLDSTDWQVLWHEGDPASTTLGPWQLRIMQRQ